MGLTIITLASLLVTNLVAQSVDRRLQGADRALGRASPISASLQSGSRFANYHRYRYEIQQAMDELCPGYKLEEFDFSKVVGGKDGETIGVQRYES